MDNAGVRPGVNVHEPHGGQQDCDICKRPAEASVEVISHWPDAQDILFHLCLYHMGVLAGGIHTRIVEIRKKREAHKALEDYG